MLPFLELPKIIINNEKKEMEVITRLQPSETADYYPGFYSGTIVVLKSGSSFFVNLPIEEFDGALLAYHSFLKANAGKFGNVKITSKPKLHVAN